MYIDTHAHFDMCLKNADRNENDILTILNNENVQRAVHVSIDAEGLRWAYEFGKAHADKGISFTLGIHPSSSASGEELNILSEMVETVIKNDDASLLFGIGETGLDYYRMRKPAAMQQKSFEFQLDLAIRHNLPVIVHSREAFEDTCNMLQKRAPVKGIMHCFPGDAAMAEKVLDLGMHVSFAGNVTFKKATALHEAAAYIPGDRLLLETDAPFLTPVPFRGKPNWPENVVHTYKFVAELRKQPLAKLIDTIEENFTLISSAG
ncbi:MAG: TatD family hydrolase [Spirochaetota bacterium]